MSGPRSLHLVSSAAGSDAQPDRAPRSRPGTRYRPCPVLRDGWLGCAVAGSGPRRGAGAVGGGARRGQPCAGGERVPGVLGSAGCCVLRTLDPAAPLCSSRGPAGTGRVGSSVGLARLGESGRPGQGPRPPGAGGGERRGPGAARRRRGTAHGGGGGRGHRHTARRRRQRRLSPGALQGPQALVLQERRLFPAHQPRREGGRRPREERPAQ